jgi:hypothetical protein
MEDNFLKRAFVLFLLVMVILCSCSNDKKVVGTWTDVEGYSWVFTDDGQLKYDDDWYKCVVTNTEMTIFDVEWTHNFFYENYSDQSYKISFSLDGKTIKLTDGKNFEGWSDAGPGWGTNQLTKK